MSSSISYGNFNFKFDTNTTGAYPVPKINWGLEKQRTNAGDLLSEEIKVTLDGVVAVSGDPQNRIQLLFEKAENLRNQIKDNDGKPFYFYFNNRAMVTGFAVVRNLTFSENQNYWTNYIDYSLELAIPVTVTGSLLIGENFDTKHITNCEDNYTFNETQEYYSEDYGNFLPKSLYELTRSISATAKAYENSASGALTYAKRWVDLREDEYPLLYFFPYSDYKLYNRKREETLSETDGTYSIRDTFLVKEGDPWIYQKKISAGYEENNFLRTISIQGEVQGLELASGIYSPNYSATHVSGKLDIDAFKPYQTYNKGDVSLVDSSYRATKYENAVSGYINISESFFDEALSYDTFSTNLIPTNKRSNTSALHAIPVSVEEGFDPQNGKVTFNRTYNSRPTGLLKGAIFETLSVDDSGPKTLITAVPVLGRRLGPLYYNPYGYSDYSTFTSGVGQRTITYEAFFPRPTGLKKYRFPLEIIDKVDSYLKLYAPSSPFNGFIVEDSQNLDLTENKLTKTIVWEYIECNP